MKKITIIERKILKPGMLPEWEQDKEFTERVNAFLSVNKVLSVSSVDPNHILVFYEDTK